MANQSGSLSEKLSQLFNPTQTFYDPEDDVNTETVAQVVDKSEELNISATQDSSKLRSRNAALLDVDDERYAGRTITRKKFQESEQNPEFHLDEKENQEDSDFGIDSVSDNSASESEEENKDDNESASEDASDDESEISADKGSPSDDDDEVVKNFSNINIKEHIQKGKATKAQLVLWDRLLEARIKLQKGLQLSNQLPRSSTWSLFMTNGDKDFKKTYNEGMKSMELLLSKLVHLQTLLFNKTKETKSIDESNASDHVSDEEIPSDSSDEEDKASVKTNLPQKRKLNFDQYPPFLLKRHKGFEEYRDATIKKWNDRTRLSTGKLKSSFAAFEQSALKQIEQILGDKQRLIRRTQLRRTIFRMLGDPDVSVEKTPKEESDNNQMMEDITREENLEKEYDEEVFDDDDFYHQLLRELIERRTLDVNDPIAVGRQWLEIQKTRSKMKRKIDTKASKGRQLRYDPHPKLINFMAPIDDCPMTEEAKNELFHSLFGHR